MEPKAWVKSITFSDNTTIQLAEDDVVVVVGPNNSGKSATLRAIREQICCTEYLESSCQGDHAPKRGHK